MAFSIARATTKRSIRARLSVAGASLSQKRFNSSESLLHPPKPIPKAPTSKYNAVTHPESPESIPPTVQLELDRAADYLLPVYARPPLVLQRGKGCYVWDTQGRRYLDFTAGVAVNALGHADAEFVQFLQTQAARLSHSSNVFYNPWATSLAELLVTLTQREGGLGWASGSLPPLGIAPDDRALPSLAPKGAKVFFANSGTEANEGAIKIARKVGKERWAAKTGKSWEEALGSGEFKKYRFACFENGFHGRSMGSLSATSNAKYQKPFAPMVPGFDVGKVNDFAGLESLVTEETCGVIVEPIQGEGGIFVVDPEWLKALRKRCDEVGAVLIYDEIQCGLYRTGTLWAHSAMPVDAHPDIITSAKPLANGYPIGAVLMREGVASVMSPGSHGTTFGGSPLACALGTHVLSRLSARPFVSHLAETALYLSARLASFPRWFPALISKEGIRGRGLMLGIPFNEAVLPDAPGRVAKMARERGVLVLTAGRDAIRLVPSLNIRKEDVDLCVDVLESVLGEMQQEIGK